MIGHESGGNDWLTNILKAKAEQHREWSKKPDEEVITWSVGSFTRKRPETPPCSVCNVDLNGKGYTSTGRYVGDVYEYKTYCPAHAPKDEDET